MSDIRKTKGEDAVIQKSQFKNNQNMSKLLIFPN